MICDNNEIGQVLKTKLEHSLWCSALIKNFNIKWSLCMCMKYQWRVVVLNIVAANIVWFYPLHNSCFTKRLALWVSKLVERSSMFMMINPPNGRKWDRSYFLWISREEPTLFPLSNNTFSLFFLVSSQVPCCIIRKGPWGPCLTLLPIY